MPSEIGWRQSREVRINLMSLFEDIIDENKKLMELQYELSQKRFVELGVLNITDTDVEVDVFSIYDKQEEIKTCLSNIHDKVDSMKTALLNDSDLIFMNLEEVEEKIKTCESDMSSCTNDIDELRGEMEEL